MRGHCVANIVDCVQNSVTSRIETERKIGIRQVVVYCSGNTDGGETLFAEHFCTHKRAVAADDDKSFYSRFSQISDALLLTFFGLEFGATRSKQNSASALNNIGYASKPHGNKLFSQKSFVSSFDSHYFHTADNSGSYNRTYCGIHSGRVSATGKYTYFFHAFFLLNYYLLMVL